MKTYVKALGMMGAIALMAALPACKDPPPSPAKVHLTAGDKHRVANEWKEAAEEYGKSLEADPTQEKVWETKAYCHQQAGDTEAAVGTLMKWSESKKDPAEKAKLIRFGADLWRQKPNMEKAEAAYLEALKVLPTDTESLSWLGEMHSQRGGARDGKAPAVPAELDKAYAYYEKIATITPDKPDPYINQRVILTKYMAYHKKDKEDAEALAKALEKDKEKAAEATARAEKAKTAMDETQKKIEAVTAKLVEANKKAKK
jgi:tetratricopeptide (TPR) repeat protein